MLINAKTARKLIAAGKAINPQFVWDDGVDHQLTQPKFVAIDRHDIQRVDHFEIDNIALNEWKSAYAQTIIAKTKGK